MRIRIVHLSDCHFNSPTIVPLEQREEALLKALASVEESVDHQILVISGDIANTGHPDEYAVAGKIFRRIQQGLAGSGTAPSMTLIVPGNHDCNFRADSAARKAVMKSVNSAADWDPSIPTACTSVQSDFFDFANTLPDARFSWKPSELITQVRIALGDHTIALWGINSAWMSQLQEQPGSIWFPVHTLQEALESADPAFNILILHHPFAWFATSIRRTLLSLVDSAFSIVIGGHEHLTETWARDDMQGRRTAIVEGGAFQEHGASSEESAFNVVLLDLTHQRASITPFEWEARRYVPGDIAETTFDESSHSIKPYRILSDKCASVLRSAGATFWHPAKGTLELLDVFVEPDLIDLDEARTGDALEKVRSTRDVLADLPEQSYLVIGGAEKAGKSTWLRWAFLHLHRIGITPVILDGASMRHAEPNRLIVTSMG